MHNAIIVGMGRDDKYDFSSDTLLESELFLPPCVEQVIWLLLKPVATQGTLLSATTEEAMLAVEDSAGVFKRLPLPMWSGNAMARFRETRFLKSFGAPLDVSIVRRSRGIPKSNLRAAEATNVTFG